MRVRNSTYCSLGYHRVTRIPSPYFHRLPLSVPISTVFLLSSSSGRWFFYFMQPSGCTTATVPPFDRVILSSTFNYPFVLSSFLQVVFVLPTPVLHRPPKALNQEIVIYIDPEYLLFPNLSLRIHLHEHQLSLIPS
ncbi:unnamed protein product [Lactuca virosa]|uniref:Uncharacterized protein n=1 Tax=Lactuca virosa TaxID=75947 RepID=A0AAU9P3S5_9ASTR|nr:unnamed protein product [Lactuca virosa]